MSKNSCSTSILVHGLKDIALKKAIIVLETSIAKGMDIITAIKISGALGTVSTQIMELDDLAKSADSKFDEIDALVAEGMNILDIELK